VTGQEARSAASRRARRPADVWICRRRRESLERWRSRCVPVSRSGSQLRPRFGSRRRRVRAKAPARIPMKI